VPEGIMKPQMLGATTQNLVAWLTWQ